MKKIAFAAFATVSALALAACQQEAAETAPEATETPAMEAPAEPVAEETTAVEGEVAVDGDVAVEGEVTTEEAAAE